MEWTLPQRDERPIVLTPCIGICTLGADGLCEGCLRTGAEIGAWSTLSDAEKRRYIDVILPARESRA